MNNSLLHKWRSVETQDNILKKELSKKNKNLNNIFNQNMTFGTAGIRGIMGAGTNKMNEFTVAAATKAYAKFLLKNDDNIKKRGIIIGHDNRHNSSLFSEVAARVMEDNGIKAFLFPNNELQPTPLISYTIRKLKFGGGIIITASHNPKEYNGFKIYNSFGGQVLPNKTKEIQEFMKKLDPLKVKRSQNDLRYLDNSLINSYINDTINGVQLLDKNYDNITVAFSPLHGTSSKIVPQTLSKLGIEHYVVEKQSSNDPNFSNTKSSNPEDSKAYNKVVSLARRKKTDLAIVTDPDADRVGVVARYKRRYKYLNGNQLASLYLEYKLNQMKRMNILPKDGYIVKTNISGNLPKRIAEKYGIKVYEVHVGFKNIANLIQNTKGTFILGYEESYGMVLNSSLVRDKDSIQSIIGVVEMTSYYKSQNINLFEKLKTIYKSYGIHRSTQRSKKICEDATNKLLKKLSKLKKINKHKVAKIEDYRKGINGLSKTNLVKVIFKNGSWFAIRPSGTEPKVKIYIQSIGSSKQKLMDIVVFEKEIVNYVEENTEELSEKHWSWKSLFKYIIFIAIAASILSFVFLKIYSNSNGQEIWNNSSTIIDNSKSGAWLFVFADLFKYTVFSAWIRKRLISFQGQNVKTRHIIVSTLMGSVISYLTPFAIGGDAIGYWYLRRKGIKRGPLLSSFITSTIVWQFGFVLQSAILVPIGLPLYEEVMFSSNPNAKGVFSMYIIGLFWDIFATFMILTLTFSKTFQEFIVRNAIKLLEWLPMIHISDPGAKISIYQYEFWNMRQGLKKIWSHKRLLLEIFFYEIFSKFINFQAIIYILSGNVKDNLIAGKYLSIIIAIDMKDTANTLSITPGGSGINEWLDVNINNFIFKNNYNMSSIDIASAMDLAFKITLSWPKLLTSSILIGNVIWIEQSKGKIIKIGSWKSSKLKIFTILFWLIFSIGWILLVILI